MSTQKLTLLTVALLTGAAIAATAATPAPAPPASAPAAAAPDAAAPAVPARGGRGGRGGRGAGGAAAGGAAVPAPEYPHGTPPSLDPPPPGSPPIVAGRPANDNYQLGPDSAPHDGVPKGKLEGPIIFHSTKVFVGTSHAYYVYVPANYDEKVEHCLMVFQDGPKAVNPEGTIRADKVFDNLIARKEIPPLIGVFISPGQSGEEYNVPIGSDPNRRGAEYDRAASGPNADNYSILVIEEILPEVMKKYNISKRGEDHAIFGSSSGASSGFNIAWRHPDQFQKVAMIIPSFVSDAGMDAFPSMIRAADKHPLRVFMQDGENDSRNAALPLRDRWLQTHDMEKALKEKGNDVKTMWGTGVHSNNQGGMLLPEILRWLWRDAPGMPAPADAPK